MTLMRLWFCLLLAILVALAAGGCSLAGEAPDTLAEDRVFLGGYGWTIAEQVATHTIWLPERFADAPGVFPVGFYWAYNNELSTDVGLDFSPYVGKRLTATLYRLNETLTDDNPNKEMRAVILRHGGKLVGAYLDRMGHFGFAGSLRRRTFSEVVGKPFGQWLTDAKVVDYGHPLYRELAKLTPRQLILAYYDALDRRRYERAYSMLSLNERIWYLFANRNPKALYNPGFRYNFGGLENIRKAEVRRVGMPRDMAGDIRPTPEFNRRVAQALQFPVDVDLTFAREFTGPSGPYHYFVGVVRETASAPWLVDGIGTGP